MKDGAMQPYRLTLDKFLEHAAKWHGDTEVVTAGYGKANGRIGYAGLKQRAMRVSAVLVDLGAEIGQHVAPLRHILVIDGEAESAGSSVNVLQLETLLSQATGHVV